MSSFSFFICFISDNFMKDLVPAKEEKEMIFSVFTNNFPKEKYLESSSESRIVTPTPTYSTGK